MHAKKPQDQRDPVTRTIYDSPGLPKQPRRNRETFCTTCGKPMPPGKARDCKDCREKRIED